MIQLVIAWTCVGVFVATAAITLLALVGVVKLAERKYLDRLFKVLVLEIVGVCIGIFTGKIELPATVEHRVAEKGETKGRERAVEALRPEMLRLSQAVEDRTKIIERDRGNLQLTDVEAEALKQPAMLDPKVFDAALKSRIAVAPR
jgi:hypothetical protein